MHLACVKMVPRALCTWLHSVPCALSDRDKLVPTVQRVPGKRSCPVHNKRFPVEPLWLGHPRPTPVVGFLETTDEDDHQQHTNNYQQSLTTANNHQQQPPTTTNNHQQPPTTYRRRPPPTTTCNHQQSLTINNNANSILELDAIPKLDSSAADDETGKRILNTPAHPPARLPPNTHLESYLGAVSLPRKQRSATDSGLGVRQQSATAPQWNDLQPLTITNNRQQPTTNNNQQPLTTTNNHLKSYLGAVSLLR